MKRETYDMCGSRGGHWVRTPLENDKNIGFLSNTGPDLLKNNKSFKRAFNVLHCILGHYWPVSETPLKWHFATRPILVRF